MKIEFVVRWEHIEIKFKDSGHEINLRIILSSLPLVRAGHKQKELETDLHQFGKRSLGRRRAMLIHLCN